MLQRVATNLSQATLRLDYCIYIQLFWLAVYRISAQVTSKKQIPQHPDLWFAKDINTQTFSGISTGYENLDAVLPNKGWPNSGLIEVGYQSIGNGELRLVIPVLKQLSQSRNKWITWINPPLIPYAPGLQSLGIYIRKILLVHTKQIKDTLWSLEKICKSKNCSAVLAWTNSPLKFKETQRLQLAAKMGSNLIYLFHPLLNHLENPSAAELRLALKPTEKPGTINVDINKRRRGWPIYGISINVSQVIDTSNNQLMDIKEKLQLWRGTKTLTPPRRKLSKDQLSSNPTRENAKGSSVQSHLLQ